MITLEDLLRREDLSQVDAAELLGCHFSSVSSWVNGRPMCTMAYTRILDLFDLQDGELLAKVGSKKNYHMLGSSGGKIENTEGWGDIRRGKHRSADTRRRISESQQRRYRRESQAV